MEGEPLFVVLEGNATEVQRISRSLGERGVRAEVLPCEDAGKT